MSMTDSEWESKSLRESISALIKERDALKAELAQIAKLIHYPDCWDTAVYLTLFDALNNTLDFNCVTCWDKKQNENQGQI